MAVTPTPRIQLYHQSSQFRHWRYSREELDQIRYELNQQAVKRVTTSWEQERAQQSAATTSSTTSSSSSSSNPPSAAPTPPPSTSEIEYLTVQDELLLVTYYLTQVQAMCGAFGFPEMVTSTAMSYLKRFYLRNTCMDYHPKNVMLTCVFLSTKTENHPISIDTFSSRVKTSPQEILSLEFLVSQSLRFEYKVHHAHLALNGLLLDLQATTTIPLPRISSIVSKSQQSLRTSRHTSLELIYTPAQIALACLRLSDPEIVEEWLGIKRDLKLKQSSEEGESMLLDKNEEMLKLLEEIGREVVERQKNPIDKERVKEIDRRLRWARNPEKDPNSALFKKRKKEEEAEREQKERDKAAKRPKPEDDGSVFD